MITVTLSSDKAAAYIEPCRPNGLLHQEFATAGGFFEFMTQNVITIPLSTESAIDLRQVLTGKAPTLTREVGQYLASFADAAAPLEAYSIIPSRNGLFAILSESNVPLDKLSTWRGFQTQQENIHRIEEGVFNIPLDFVATVVSRFPTFTVSPDLQSLDVNTARQASLFKMDAEKPANRAVDLSVNFTFDPVTLDNLDPFPEYDGSLSSLRSVPLVSYEYIKTDIVKCEKSRAKKAPKPLIKKLQEFGINSAFDILHHFPLRYIDRSNPQLVRNLVVGEESSIVGTIISKNSNREKRYIQFKVKDSVGAVISLTFFQQLWMAGVYHEGDEVMAYGKFAPFNGSPSFSSPRMDKVGDERARLPMIPVYPQSDKIGITTWEFVTLLKETLARMQILKLREPLTDTLIQKYKIPSRAEAYMGMHFPTSKQESVDASRRLVYEELFRLQLFIQRQKLDITQRRGIAHKTSGEGLMEHYLDSLPYTPTGAQQRAINALREDMSRPHPMHRLLQGDVGAGKTVVAVAMILATVDNGHQGALMAPTEILAEQLHNGIVEAASTLISPRTHMPMNIRFLAGKTRVKEKREIYAGLEDGSIDIVVGTHGILSDGVVFSDLGAVVIDEQHRFGVEQRTKLRDARADGLTPDLLAMSATPIPRSSAMVLYGDMDITVLDELPPGRTPIETIWLQEDAQLAVVNADLTPWMDIREQVNQGHQAYVVASLVEDNETLAAQSVMDAYDSLQNIIYPDFKIGMVHGKQKRVEREETMAAFAAGEINILVATTVIEVGVNVPNSTVMVVLDPGRFGIAQLHQIRGRVGRSNLASRCYLLGETKTDDGRFRLNALVESTDGFYLSEKDLELRGEGTLFSMKQSGESDLYLAELRQHMHVLEVAKVDAEHTLSLDSKLTSTDGNRMFKQEIEIMMEGKVIRS